jgi:Rrf2 family transcriptional regulator, nitric oxide-sensitive transcriptional repressor
MLTKTSILALRSLIFLCSESDDAPSSPRRIAEQLNESPTYLAKVVRHLVKAGILQAHRGTTGGVTLNQPVDEVSLLVVVEACQGKILGSFCQDTCDLDNVCAFHEAAAELHDAIVSVLSRWTLADLVKSPHPLIEGVSCVMHP